MFLLHTELKHLRELFLANNHVFAHQREIISLDHTDEETLSRNKNLNFDVGQ